MDAALQDFFCYYLDWLYPVRKDGYKSTDATTETNRANVISISTIAGRTKQKQSKNSWYTCVARDDFNYHFFFIQPLLNYFLMKVWDSCSLLGKMCVFAFPLGIRIRTFAIC